MTSFQRSLAPEIIDRLKEDPLFAELKTDCKKGDVFPVVRGGYMSFYYAGGSLFKYDANGFSTHIKYAFVPKGSDDCYLSQENLQSKKGELETNFVDGYKKIKKRCELYAGDEDAGISNLYKYSPVLGEGNIYLVDIEVAFTAENDNKIGKERKSTDRIDILLYDNEKGQLLFCEAKHFSNNEIRASKGRTPAVVGQLNRYNDQIAEKKEQICVQYEKRFDVLYDLFGVRLNPPKKIYPHCGLLLFGFDNDQRKGRLDEHLPSLEAHKYYAKGNLKGNLDGKKGISAETLYKCLTDECKTNHCGPLCWRKK